MNWFKENKFLGLLIVVTVVLTVLLLVFGIGKKGETEDLMAQIDQAKDKIRKQSSLDPFPNPTNLKKKGDNLKKVVSAANEAQQALLAYAPLSLEDIPVNEFTAKLDKAEAAVREAFGEDVLYPEDFHLGFGQYKGAPPNSKATGELAYQLDAFEWLFKELANAGISELDNFVRVEIPQERGEDWGGPKQTGNKKKRNRRKKGARKPTGPVLPKIAEKMPFELTFSGRQAAVRKAFAALADSEKYFFAIRAFRGKNPAAIPSNKKLDLGDEEENDEPLPEGSLFNEEEDDAEEVVEEPASSDERILHPVSGGEDLKIYVRADLLLLSKDPKFPEVK